MLKSPWVKYLYCHSSPAEKRNKSVILRGQRDIIHVGKIISHNSAVWHFAVVTVQGQRVVSSPRRFTEHVRLFLSDSSRIWHNITSCSMSPSYFCPALFIISQFLHLCCPFDVCSLDNSVIILFLCLFCFISNPSLPPHNNHLTIDELYAQKLKYKAISEELDHALNDMTSM